MTADEIAAQAALQAALKYDPQSLALQNSYELQRQAYENQIASTKANYSGVESSVQAALEAAEKRSLDQAIAQGGGMSGMGTWLSGEAYKSIMPQLTEAKAQEAAALSGIGNNISLALQQYNNQIQSLSGLRGQEELSLINQLQESDYEKQMQNAQLVASVMADINSINWEQEKWAQQYELQKQGLDAETAAREADRIIEQQKVDLQREALATESAAAEADRAYRQQLLAQQQAEFEHQASVDLANLTGYYNDNPTMAMQALTADQMNAIAEILGYYPFATNPGGAPTPTPTPVPTPVPTPDPTPTPAPVPTPGDIDPSQIYGGYGSFEELMAAIDDTESGGTNTPPAGGEQNTTPTPGGSTTTPPIDQSQIYGGYGSFEELMAALDDINVSGNPTTPPVETPATPTAPTVTPTEQPPSTVSNVVNIGDYTFDKEQPYGGYEDFVGMFNDIGKAKELDVPAPNRKTKIAKINGYNFNSSLPYGGYEDFDSMMQAIEAAATSPPSSSSITQNGYTFYKDRPYGGYASLDELGNALSHVTSDRIWNEFNTQVVERPQKQ